MDTGAGAHGHNRTIHRRPNGAHPMSLSKAEEAEIAARRIELVKLRRAGVPFEDPRILALGYKSRQHASKDLIRTLRKRSNQQAAEVAVYRQEENERLDALLAAVWPYATNPIAQPKDDHDDDGYEPPKYDGKAIDTALKILDRRAKLNGLDMPARIETSGPDGGPLRLAPADVHQLHALIGMAGEPDPGDDGEAAPGREKDGDEDRGEDADDGTP